MVLSIGAIFRYLVLFFPLISTIIYSSFFYNTYEFPKFIFLIVGGYIIGLTMIYLRKRQIIVFLIKKDLFNKLVLAFIVTTLVADAFGVNWMLSLYGSAIRYQGFISLFSCYLLFFATQIVFSEDKKAFSLFLKFSRITAIALSLIGITQYLLVKIVNFPFHLYQDRIIVTFGNPNFFGCFLAMALPFVLLQESKNKKILVMRLGEISILLTAIFLTGSRSALFACLLSISVWLFLRIKSKLRYVFFIAFILATVSGIFLLGPRSSTWDNRIIIYKVAIERILERPILGFGQESFSLLFPAALHYNVDSPHNIILEQLISSGIIGTLLFIFLSMLALKRASMAVKLSIISFLVVGFFNPLSLANIVFFWFLLGVAGKPLNKE